MHFLKWLLTPTFLLLSAIAALNCFVDPTGIFYGSDKLEYAMARELTEKNNLVVTGNFNDREFIRYRLLLEDYQPDVLVSGSSRIMQIGMRTYPEKVLNLGVSCATLQDHIALLFMALKKITPKKIILGIDPMIFNANSYEMRWHSIEREYNEYVKQLLPNSPEYITQPSVPTIFDSYVWDRWKHLLSMDYTIASYHKLMKLSGLENIQPTSGASDNDTPLPHSDKIRKDGSLVYNSTYANSSKEEIDAKIPLYSEYTLERFSYSENRMILLSALIDYLQKRFTVEIFLAPYYPGVFEVMKTKVPGVQHVETEVRAMAKEKNIPVIGSYNPDTVHCTNEDFYDGAHPKDSCIQRIWANARNVP